MQEAAARRAVVAGAEGEPRLDLDRRCRWARPVRGRARHARETGRRAPARGRPANWRPSRAFPSARSSTERRGLRRPPRPRSARANPPRRARSRNRPPPATPCRRRPGVLGLERGRGGFGRLEALDDEIGDGARPPLVDVEASVDARRCWAAGLRAWRLGRPPTKINESEIGQFPLSFIFRNEGISKGYQRFKSFFPAVSQDIPDTSKAIPAYPSRPLLFEADRIARFLIF